MYCVVYLYVMSSNRFIITIIVKEQLAKKINFAMAHLERVFARTSLIL